MNKRTNQLIYSPIKNSKKVVMDHLSTTVTSANHNTALGWNENKTSSRRITHSNQIKVIDNSGYNYENKFFPRRNISSKLKYMQIGPKKKTLICPANLPESITGSVPSRTNSKLASYSFMKGTPIIKKTYFSPNLKKKAPYQPTWAHPPIYKR
jgi:hypothetical protein